MCEGSPSENFEKFLCKLFQTVPDYCIIIIIIVIIILKMHTYSHETSLEATDLFSNLPQNIMFIYM